MAGDPGWLRLRAPCRNAFAVGMPIMVKWPSAPYAVGDQIKVLRSDRGGTVCGPLPVERVTPLDGRRWRIGTTRIDGSALEVVVDVRGRDAHGYAEPVR